MHARSYVPAAIALAVGVLARRPYVFDMRGFLPEEYVDVGYWTTSDIRYRVAKAAERLLLAGAAGIICPSTDAERRLRSAPEHRGATRGKPIVVQPSMVDLERFRPLAERDPVPTLVYSGSLGTWYMLDEMLALYARARQRVAGMRFLIVTRSDPALVRDGVRRAGLDDAPIASRPAGYSEMPELLGRAHVAIALVRQAPSKLGASALKVAEYLACGLPVVINAGLGDADGLVARYGAGHVLPSYRPDELDRAAAAVAELVGDERARANARRLAEEHFDLAVGVERYHALYAQVLGSRSGIMAG
jgi:glycosyltransferase involved in cell wall biosynthesis